MAEQTLIEQLDRALEALLASRDSDLPTGDPTLAPLLALAADLRALPRPDFRARLKADLERRASMQAAPPPVRSGFRTLTPYLVAEQPAALIDFLARAFGATEALRTTGSAGGTHAELRLADSMIMLGGGAGSPGRPTALHFYVADADAAYQAALNAGATSLSEPVDQEYGDREAALKDPAGNVWYVATHKGPAHIPAGMHAVTPFLHPKGAGDYIKFLEVAFAGEVVEYHESQPGTVVHARVQLGDSFVEMGEAHGPWQPMPSMFYLYVKDVEAAYARALAAGATSVEPPADQPYGERRASVKDGQGNSWYLAAPVAPPAP